MKKIIVLFVILFFAQDFIYAGPGDTTLVQTFTFNDITKRRGWYVFPSDTNNWHKVLMYYTLKCDAATTQDQYPCGEWDYTTYTNAYIHQNTSNNRFSLVGNYPDSIPLRSDTSYSFYRNYQYFTVYDNVISENSYGLGIGSNNTGNTFNTANKTGKSQYIWTASELTNAGLSAGEINKLSLNFATTGIELKNLKIKIKNYSLDTFAMLPADTSGFICVYNLNTTISSTGMHSFDFTHPFVWDGSSNILVEFSFSNDQTGLNSNVVYDQSAANTGIYSDLDDDYLYFDNTDYVEVPASAFSDIDSLITVAFWQYGDPDVQPSNSYIFEGRDGNGNRVINSHLPWSNGNVYWDAGNSGTSSYDRIYTSAIEEDYEGRWNHWAFTKNVENGEMKIYLNGSLWHSGTGHTRTMGDIQSFKIAVKANAYGAYDGGINDFQIWNTDLDSTYIQNLMYQDVNSSHPFYSNLMAYYKFDEIYMQTAYDHSIYNRNAMLFGLPDVINMDGEELFRNFQLTNNRPVIEFTQGNYQYHLDSVLQTDSVPNTPLSVIISEPYIDMAVSGLSENIIDTITGWPASYSYVYTNGTISDSVYYPHDTIYYNKYKQTTHQIQNYVTPYGIGLDLGPNGFTWIYDVTDYMPFLHDTLEIRAGNQQELIDLKFAFIEGTPVRDVVDMETIWLGDYSHANIADDVSLPAVNVNLNPNADMFTVKTRTTGHWFGGVNNCAEFCPKYHHLKINGNMEFQWLNWTECSMNPVYPQGGTWLYDRAGWCPGAFADTYDHDITPFVSPGSTISLDYGMQAYPPGGGEGNYRTTVQLISYSDFNFTNDAALVDIVSPNSWEYHNRFNPVCDNPVIVIQNTGSNNLNSLSIDYGLDGNFDYNYTWMGDLEPLEKDTVILPAVSTDYFLSDSLQFVAQVSSPNSVADECSINNLQKTDFLAPPVYNDDLMVFFRTNNAPSESWYEVIDAAGNVVFEKYGAIASHLYIDTLSLSPGCYTLILHDTDDDGISWWANNDGTGFIKIFLLNGGSVTFENDFGREIRQSFIIGSSTLIHKDYGDSFYNIYPNPAREKINVEFKLSEYEDVEISISDIYGRIIKSTNSFVKDKIVTINTQDISSGIYLVNVSGNKINDSSKIIIK